MGVHRRSTSGNAPCSIWLPTICLLLFLCWTGVVSSAEENLYKILGVSKTATAKEIKKAYRKKALDTHPDKRKDIPADQAAAEFHRVVHAFEILSDDNSRKLYDRTGRTQQGSGSGGGGGGGGFHGFGNFHFQWNHGGQYRKRRLKDQFRVQEAMSRVMHIVSLSQLETVLLDDDNLLERNLLMVFVTPGDVETICDDEIVFPYPFAAMSEQGIWWEDLLQTVKIRFNKANGLTRFFNVPKGDELRAAKQPIFLFGRRGHPLSESFARIQTSNRQEFETWMWKQIEVSVTFRNEHPHAVELHWIHGNTAHNKGTLEPGQESHHVTMLTHEWWVRDARVDTRSDSPGRYKLTKVRTIGIVYLKFELQVLSSKLKVLTNSSPKRNQW